MKTNQVRQKYIEYFSSLNHTDIGSSSLVPENDPTTLFTGSGMQPLIPYLLGEKHPDGSRLVNAQRCFRAEDIDEVGDNRHTTFFEMLGNWSLGDYFKAEQIPWIYTFLTEEIGLEPEKIYVTVFGGDKKSGVESDQTSLDTWQEIIRQKNVNNDIVYLNDNQKPNQKDLEKGRIFIYGSEKNWWSRAGAPEQMPTGEPGGPDSEIFFDFGTPHNPKFGPYCHPNCDCGRFIEIGNSVFMEYKKNKNDGFDSLPNKNVDFGGGLERITAAGNNRPDIFTIDVFQNLITAIEQTNGRRYDENRESFRIIADHLRGAVFMLADGITPSNTDQGYFVRRLLRRAIRYLDTSGTPEKSASALIETVINDYGDYHTHLKKERDNIQSTIDKEEEKFRSTLNAGLAEFNKKIKNQLSGKEAWYLFMTYGFPVEMTKDLAQEKNITLDKTFNEDFQQAKNEHKEASKKGAEKKFKGGLADQSEMSVKYHTATHLLHAALKKILGEHTIQKGSNITPQRLRFDFKHDTKLTHEQIKEIENEINANINKSFDVTKQEMTRKEAKVKGAMGLFDEKYGDKVSVYTIDNISSELCGGPHVKNTSELDTFRVTKEESAGAGIRRIKAVLE